MTISRLILAIVVVFIATSALGTLIHAYLLAGDYASVGSSLYRAQADLKLPLIFVSNLAFAIGAVWIYSHGVEDKPWIGQGFRFGIALWLVVAVPSFLVSYAVQPVPEMLVAKQLAYEFVNKVLLGIVTAAMVRKA